MSSEIAMRARATGRVQGVAYRAWARSEARALGLRGWVKNEDDGSVTALLIGPEEAVETMLDAMWSGPGAAAVRDVSAGRAEVEPISGFEIRG